jgi:anti-anti-sigma factor
MDKLETKNGQTFAFAVDVDDAGTMIVSLRGELDLSTLAPIVAKVDPMLAETPKRLIVDASELRFGDSSALALWVRWAGRVPEFELRNPSPMLRKVIWAMGLADALGLRS